jgi:hypothetical protein
LKSNSDKIFIDRDLELQESVVAATVVSEALDTWSVGMLGAFVFSNETLWSHISVPDLRVPWRHGRKCESEGDRCDLKNFGPKEAGCLSGCLRVEPSDPCSAFDGLQRSLFTRDSTVSANTLVHMQSTDV